MPTNRTSFRNYVLSNFENHAQLQIDLINWLELCRFPPVNQTAEQILNQGPVVQKAISDISLIQDQWKFCGQNYKDVDKDV